MYNPQVYIDDRTIPNLMSDLNFKNVQITDLEHHSQEINHVRHNLEEENLRLRRYVTDMQHRYESMAQRRDWEIESLTGRVMYLEEELFNLSRKHSDPIVGIVKDEYDPQLTIDLQRHLKLKQEEVDQLKRLLQDERDRSQLYQMEASSSSRKDVQHELKVQDFPFVVQNDDLKKQLAEARRQNTILSQELVVLRSKQHERDAEIEKLNRKSREHMAMEKLRVDKEEDFKRSVQPVYIKVNEDENLITGLLGLVQYVRESLSDAVFEVFVRSANQAQTKKTNSTVVFSINIKEMKERSNKGLLIVVCLYKRMKQFVKIYIPLYGKIGKQAVPHQHSRDNTNQWLENNITLCLQQRKDSKKEQNKEYFHLYRLQALMYRTRYPMKSDKPLQLDEDVRVRLEHKICVSLTKIFMD